MNTPHPFIPLYFGEEDQDIWAALCQTEPEHRSALVKELLRQALIGDKTFDERADDDANGRVWPADRATRPGHQSSGLDLTAGGDQTVQPEESDSENKQNASENVRFDLDSLFMPQAMMTPGRSNDGGDSQEVAGGVVIDPVDADNETEFVSGQQFNLSDLFVTEFAGNQELTHPVKPELAPWENLLFNIIGTEDDENVIAAFSQAGRIADNGKGN